MQARRRVGVFGACTKDSGNAELSVRAGFPVADIGLGVTEFGHRHATGVATGVPDPAVRGVDSVLDGVWKPGFLGASGQTVVLQTVEAALIGVDTAAPVDGSPG